MNKKITIMHLRSSLQTSTALLGGEKVILTLCDHIDREKFQPVITVLKDNRAKEDLPLEKHSKLNNLTTEVISLKHPFDLSAVSSLKTLLKKHSVDILHTHEYKSNLIGALAACQNKDIKLITTAHGWTRGSIKLRIYEFIDKLIIRSFRRVAAVSESMKSRLLKAHIPNSKICIIPNAISPDKPSSADKLQQLRTSLGLLNDSIVIGTVGRLSHEKGQRYLIDATQKLAAKYPNIRLLIVGDGPELENLVNLDERVIFTGYRDDVIDLISIMDIFVLPSLIEGLPLALLEAMYCRKPVVASHVGGIPELIINNETGVLVEPKNADSLTLSIGKLLEDRELSNKIADNANKRIINKYSPSVMARLYEQLYLEL